MKEPFGTMCDFFYFGLTFFPIMSIQVVAARLPQRLKSTFLETFFFTLLVPLGPLHSKKFQKEWPPSSLRSDGKISKNVDFSL